MYKKGNTLGIIAYCNGSHFQEKGYYKKLTLIGRKMGIRVFVFSPRRVDFASRLASGYEFRQGIWQATTLPLPSVIYDRCFIGPSYRHYKPFIEKLQNDPNITFLGLGLSGKWQVYQIISQSRELQKWLPETQLFSMAKLDAMLKEQRAAIIKPAAGTHGIGVVRIAERNGIYTATGRASENRPFTRKFRSRTELEQFVTSFIRERTFLLQPYLALHTPDGTPYDVRVLVQKGRQGRWETTGKAVRIGNRHNITSNLHGGGRAVPLSVFLAEHFPGKTRERIEEEIDQVVGLLPPFLEEHHGRLVELGIDIGIDKEGHVWIIEVNSKPGRTVFRHIADRVARIRSIAQPVKYAHYLMHERVGGN
jgi:glutathione synthase/RimK-type ligase-like ATP-grasp enzyme